MKALVLAAGQGERLWPLTDYEPKPLLPIGNVPLVEHVLGSLVSSRVTDIVVLVRFQAEKVKEKLGSGKRFGCKITYVKQQIHGGTADAVRSATDEFHNESKFLVVYGDNYYAKNAVKRFVISGMRKTVEMSMAVSKVPDPSQFGSVDVRQGQVVGIHEKQSVKASGLVNTGLYMLNDTLFDAVRKTRKSTRGEYELTDSLQSLLDKGHLLQSFQIQQDEWLSVTYPWDLLAANQSVVKSEKTQRVSGKIEKNVHVNGLLNVGQGSIVKSGTYVEGPVIIGKNCSIGPHAYLRPFATIGDNVKIGASCEVKNSIVMDDAKIPHLSYVGDSVIGKNCNLGAGTVTANIRFDHQSVKSKVKQTMVNSGRKKLGAILGWNVNTGINVSLLPGVKVGADTWIGPGVTLKADVANGSRLGR